MEQEKAYVITNGGKIEEVTICSSTKDMSVVCFTESKTHARLRKNRIFTTKELAQKELDKKKKV